MSARHQKGSHRPDPKLKRHQDPRHGHYPLTGGVPWPSFADGSMYADRIRRVTHVEASENVGTIQALEWAHPDGSYMKGEDRMTKAKTPRLKPGAWYAIVSWDERDRFPEIKARVALAHLVPIDPEA